MTDTMTFRQAEPRDAARCYEIESAAYPPDQAATQDKIAKRIAGYPEGFLILELGGQSVWFINSGCAFDVEMSDDDFKEMIGHDPAAPNVVVMSVVLDPAFQGRGLSTHLMRAFVADMRARGKASIHLMCKEVYLPFYEKFGYRFTRPSASGFAGVPWFEMVMDLTAPQEELS